MAENWAATQQHNEHMQRPEDQATILVIRQLLDGTTKPESAALDIASNYEPLLLQKTPVSWSLCTLLCEAILHAATTFEDFERIVQMLMHVSKLADVIVDGEPFKENERTYWHDIPKFSFWFMEHALHVNTVEDMDLGRCAVTWSEQARQYKVANIFGALYLCALDPLNSAIEFRSMAREARRALCSALEVDVLSVPQIRRASIYIPAAAQWLLHSGSLIWEFCKMEIDDDGQNVWQEWLGGSDGSKPLWQGKECFCVQRWGFWKQRFDEIAGLARRRGRGRVVDDVVLHARQALMAMGMVEQEDAASFASMPGLYESEYEDQW